MKTPHNKDIIAFWNVTPYNLVQGILLGTCCPTVPPSYTIGRQHLSPKCSYVSVRIYGDIAKNTLLNFVAIRISDFLTRVKSIYFVLL
jgi:hypothetical protein